jgi:general secretion pathway protein A
MYTSFFGFKENPFSLTPDPSYLYLSRHHQAAFDHLLYGINERKGFIVITGGIGTGKTTLCRALLSTLDRSTKTALVLNAYISDVELLRTINQEFGIDGTSPSQTKKDYIDGLNKFLLDNYSHGGNAVLLIDEAQNLSHTVLEQIRMLSNLETEKEKLVQIVLVGQLELRELLSSPSLKQLDERIMVRYDLQPLDRLDVQGYVGHRLVVAGGKGHLRFTDGAFGAIYAYSQGNPRRINAVCDRALLIAYSKDQFSVSKKTVRKAVEDISGRVTPQPSRGSSWVPRKVAALCALLLLLIGGAGLGGWQLRKFLASPISGEPTVTGNRRVSMAAPEKPLAQEPIALEGEEEADDGEEAEIDVAEPEDGGTLRAEAQVKPASPVSGSDAVVAAIPDPGEPTREEEKTASSKPEAAASLPEASDTQPANLFLEDRASVGELFKAYYAKERHRGPNHQEAHLGIYSLRTEPEHHVMFKKPFRVRVLVPPEQSGTGVGAAMPGDQYLLISEVTPDGGVAIDAEGKERPVSGEFILSHWGHDVCWVYPYEPNGVDLVRGMHGPDVIELQRRLNDAGYLLEITGIFDEPTFRKVIRLQSDFGLEADGIVGQQTQGLLFEMSE